MDPTLQWVLGLGWGLVLLGMGWLGQSLIRHNDRDEMRYKELMARMDRIQEGARDDRHKLAAAMDGKISEVALEVNALNGEFQRMLGRVNGWLSMLPPHPPA